MKSLVGNYRDETSLSPFANRCWLTGITSS